MYVCYENVAKVPKVLDFNEHGSSTSDFVVVHSLSPVQFFCDPLDCSPPGSFVHRISQVRKLEWVAISFSTEIISMKFFYIDLPVEIITTSK